MADVHRASGELNDPEVFRYTTDYFVRLLKERHAIRSALLAPGSSITLRAVEATTEDVSQRYSSVIGNDIHLDLLEAEYLLSTLNKGEQKAVLDFCDGLSARESSYYDTVKPDAIKKRRQRAIKKVAPKWANRHSEEENHAERSTQVDA